MRRPTGVLLMMAGAFVGRPIMAGGQSVVAGAVVQSYSFDNPVQTGLADVSLMWTPFAASVPLGPFAGIDLTGGFARAAVTGAGGERAELSGRADTQLGVSLRLAGGRLVLRAGASAPTALSTQSPEEARVLGVLAAELLSFSAGPWVGGDGLTASAQVNMDSGELRMSVLSGYSRWNERELLQDGGFSYRPGSELRVRVITEADLSRTKRLGLVFGYQRFETDHLGDANLFRPGTRFEALASYAFPVGMIGSGLLYGGVRHRSQGAAMESLDWFPGLTNAPSRNLFLLGLETRIGRGRFFLRPEGQLRVLRGDQGVCFLAAGETGPGEIVCPSGQGWLTTVGTAFEVPLTGPVDRTQMTLAPLVRLRVGRAVHWGGHQDLVNGSLQPAEDPGSRILGWEVGLTGRLGVGG